MKQTNLNQELRHAQLHNSHKRPSNMHNHISSLHTQTTRDAPSLVQRSAHTCGADGKSNCETNADASGPGGVTIGIAAAVPVVVALIILFFLHRRIKRKMRREDAEDKHKSLDFGLQDVPAPLKGGLKGKPEMSINTSSNKLSRNRGMSMDMDIPSPYLLPAGVHDSRESLQSLSRTMNDPNDPYRPVTFLEHGSRASSRLRTDHISAASTRSNDIQKVGLLQQPGNVYSSDNQSHSSTSIYENKHLLPQPPISRNTSASDLQRTWSPASSVRKYGSETPPDHEMAPLTPRDMLSDSKALPAFPNPVRHISPEPVTKKQMYDSPQFSSHEDALGINVPPPTSRSPESLARANPPNAIVQPEIQQHNSQPQFDFDLPLPSTPPMHDHNMPPVESHIQMPVQDNMNRMSVMGMRPLPPDDPSDNPEQRANRIRSFYREYFDETKPNPPGQYPEPMPYFNPADYNNHYDYQQPIDDGVVYDPETGSYITANQQQQHQQYQQYQQYQQHQQYQQYQQHQRPFAEPMERRAMTPPPRMPGQSMRKQSMESHGSIMSSQSRGRQMSQGQIRRPPPAPLSSLPTPHLLREDSSLMFDYAPPVTFRERQLGRAPDSPTGTMRAFSPAFKAHTPLGNSFDDLAIMPSPHALRSSGTFTGLDFAPPPRFKDRGDSFSETGSVRSYRSNRSGISAVQSNAIRAGAYRMSRLPKDAVGTKLDLETSLKPQWNIGR